MKKKYLFIVVVFFASVLLAGCRTAEKPALVAPAVIKKGITMDVVASHSTSTDCWLVINNNVYNITDYISEHPGGEEKIVKHCGVDATEAFETKDGLQSGTHSDEARKKLSQYYVGDLSR